MKWGRRFLAAAAIGLLSSCATHTTHHRTYSFALIGDVQYTLREEALFPDLIDAINREPVAFVVHLGDFKAGSNSPCTDTLYQSRLADFERSIHPLMLLTGDNDWVDCRRPSNGPYAPLERLQKLRSVFYATPESLGKKRLPLMRQSEVFALDATLARYRENLMWVRDGVVYASLNIQGSNDNKGFSAEDDAEWAERLRANTMWLKHAMARAREDDIAALVIFIQANPGFEEPPATVQASAFKPFLDVFESEAVRFGKPVLFTHGDTHQFRVEPYKSPLDKRSLPNVTRLEGYGSPSVNWVRVTVDANNRAQPFVIQSGGFLPVTPK
jgi:Calcineurin-like phosphoesterase